MIPRIAQIGAGRFGNNHLKNLIRLDKEKIIKFNGGYHGHVDSLLIKAGSGNLTFSKPISDGVPKEFIKNTISIPFNNSESVEEAFKNHPSQIAAIIVEPICGNMGVVLPKTGYLQALRKICTQNNTVLIFDEVMTAFRVDLEGAQGLYEIEPDLKSAVTFD